MPVRAALAMTSDLVREEIMRGFWFFMAFSPKADKGNANPILREMQSDTLHVIVKSVFIYDICPDSHRDCIAYLSTDYTDDNLSDDGKTIVGEGQIPT